MMAPNASAVCTDGHRCSTSAMQYCVRPCFSSNSAKMSGAFMRPPEWRRKGYFLTVAVMVLNNLHATCGKFGLSSTQHQGLELERPSR